MMSKLPHPLSPTSPPTLDTLHSLLQAPGLAYVVSRLYRATLIERPNTQTGSRAGWDLELDTPLTDGQWLYCCKQTGMITASSQLRIIHFIFLHRVYYTLARLYRYNLRPDDQCDRCRQEGAGFLHLAWRCGTIHRYWLEVEAALSRMVKAPIISLRSWHS